MNPSMSLQTMITHPERAEDLTYTVGKLDRWDALIRDHGMKFGTAFFAMAPETWSRTRLLGKETWTRGGIKWSRGGNQPSSEVGQLKLTEVASDLVNEVSEGGSDRTLH